MASNDLRNRYIQDGAGVVSQQKLLVMLYDRLVLDCEQAVSAIGAGDWAQTNDKLQHAQAILLELSSALDVEAWEGAQQMLDLYTWFDDELTAANVKKDQRRIVKPLKLIRELRDAWTKAEVAVRGQQEQTRVAGGSTFSPASV